MNRTLIVALATASACCLSGRTTHPAIAPASTPLQIGVRNAHAMAYDAAHDRVLLFGGADASSVRHDTWTWDGDRRRWSLMTQEGPQARTFPAIAFDEMRGEVVLFGGNRVLFGRDGEWDTLLGDTWILRGNLWRRRDVPGPEPRAEAAMTYDRRRGRAVLFGGYSRDAKGRTRLGDTWEWDGDQWTQVSRDGPPPRNGGVLAFDERRGVVVLSGGPPAFVTPETWEWNGTVWRVAPPPDPPARFNPVMTYHARAGALLRFGGWTGSARAADTWMRANGTWREIDVAGPSPRNHSSIAYDAHRGRAVLFGGHDGERVFGDTWEFDGKKWMEMAHAAPQLRVKNDH